MTEKMGGLAKSPPEEEQLSNLRVNYKERCGGAQARAGQIELLVRL